MIQKFFLFFTLFVIFASPCSVAAEQPKASDRQLFIDTARLYLGTPYQYGGSSVKGIDCSGFVLQAAKKALGLSLPRSARNIAAFSTKIPDEDRKPGDLLFFNTVGGISHVGIYLGDGRFIHAASAGPRTGVIISKLSESYWKKTYRFSGRIITTR